MDHGINLHADGDRLARLDFMRAHALHRHVAAAHFSHDARVFIVIEDADVANLAAGVGIERRVVEHDLAFFVGIDSAC